jgi:hypothetical protein
MEKETINDYFAPVILAIANDGIISDSERKVAVKEIKKIFKENSLKEIEKSFDATASRIVGESALIKNRQKLAIKYLDKFDESEKLQILKISINSASADRFHELEKEIITSIVEHYKFSYEKIFFSN